MLVKIFKLAVVVFLIIKHMIQGAVARLFHKGKDLRRKQLRICRNNTNIMLSLLNVKVTYDGKENWKPNQGYLIVSNHLSYLDMLALMQGGDLCFVSTVEVQKTPVLGSVAEASGAIFIERRSRENIKNEIAEMSRTLNDGFSLNFFPEGTSTNGRSVLPFKKSLFATALESRVPVLPVVIQPTEINGQPASASNIDFYAYHGDMDFTPHIMALAGCKEIKVTVKILPPIPVDNGITRDELAQKAHDVIEANFRPLV
jgi:1-acyl-sn-glycerol-3-phosphate acyltransferase